MSMGLKANADGSGAVQVGGSDAITITSGLAVSMNGGAVYPLVSGTAQASTSGTAVDFTGIPSWVKRITVMFNGVSTNGTSNPLIQIGAGSVTTSGYSASSSTMPNAAATIGASFTTGFGIASSAAINILYGHIVLTNVTGNTWVGSLAFGFNSPTSSAGGGSVALSGTLDRVRITTVNGTDTFDAGSINIMWE